MLNLSASKSDTLSLRMRLVRGMLAVLGWKLVSNTPAAQKYVIVCAPHTSLWDYPLFLAAVFCLDNNYRWLGHAKLFRGFFGPLVRRFGGFELKTDPTTSFVEKLRDEFSKQESLVFCLTPEGSSAFVPRWRSGFYYLALAANVPIGLGFIDYKNKTLGLSEYFMPSGDIDKDVRLIQDFYRNITPKNPDRAGVIKL